MQIPTMQIPTMQIPITQAPVTHASPIPHVMAWVHGWAERLITRARRYATSLTPPKTYMGLNERQLHFISRHNRKEDIRLVDDKWKTKRALSACPDASIRVPDTYLTVHTHRALKRLDTLLRERPILDPRAGLVIKPIQGWGGKGILVLTERIDERHYRSADNQVYAIGELLNHTREILSGMYSLGGRRDGALIEELIHFSPDLKAYSRGGVPDIRVVLYRGVPISAMLRLATERSHGCANLSKGGVGVGINLETGLTTHAVQFKKPITHHPDTSKPLSGFQVPRWDAVLELATRAAQVSNLGFCGVDIVLDINNNPLILELNARPGLAIQIANRAGHLTRVQRVEALVHKSIE